MPCVGEVLAHRLDHRRRAAQVDRDVAVVEVLGPIRLSRSPCASAALAGSATQWSQVRPVKRGGELVQRVELHQVVVGADAVDEVRGPAVLPGRRSARSIDRIGASPVPPASSSTGRSVSRRKKLPLGPVKVN